MTLEIVNFRIECPHPQYRGEGVEWVKGEEGKESDLIISKDISRKYNFLVLLFKYSYIQVSYTTTRAYYDDCYLYSKTQDCHIIGYELQGAGFAFIQKYPEVNNFFDGVVEASFQPWVAGTVTPFRGNNEIFDPKGERKRVAKNVVSMYYDARWDAEQRKFKIKKGKK